MTLGLQNRNVKCTFSRIMLKTVLFISSLFHHAEV